MNESREDGPVHVHVNGEAKELPAGTTMADVVADLVGGVEVRGVAAALNGSVVPRGRWGSCLLAEDDRIEVLTAVQGG